MLAGQQDHMEGPSGLRQEDKANMPQFANMAIRDVDGDITYIKQESMDIDLSEENFPSLSENNLTYHDELHQDHMGGRIIYSPRVQVTSSMGEEIDDILGSAVTNSPVLTENPVYQLTKDEQDREDNRAYDKHIKSEAIKSKQWFDQEMIKHKKLLDRLTMVESRIPEPGSQAEIDKLQRKAKEKAADKKFCHDHNYDMTCDKLLARRKTKTRKCKDIYIHL